MVNMTATALGDIAAEVLSALREGGVARTKYAALGGVPQSVEVIWAPDGDVLAERMTVRDESGVVFQCHQEHPLSKTTVDRLLRQARDTIRVY